MFQKVSDEALASLDLDGTIIGINSVSVSRSRTAICPINPKFLPQVSQKVFLPIFDLHPKDVAMPNNVLTCFTLLYVQSEAEWETCLRTIYCTNISKIVCKLTFISFT